ncbi:MAG: efflux RND transporter periplasmic adaptor subunit [Rhodoferax sp.]|nr:efflux RND transporter periplasmic adaptor subunit [Rhodoferax sp.]
MSVTRHLHGFVHMFAALALAAPVWAQTAAVPTTVVQPKAVGASYELDGVIQAVKQSTVAAQASGRIATFVVKAGDKVRAGQLLATIDDREAVAGVQRSQAQINQADAELRNAQSNLERTRDLQSKGFISKAALDTAEAQHKGATAVRDQAIAGARQSSISQGFTRVTAPFDGWVLQTSAEAGELAVPGKPLLTVYAPQPLRAVVQVPASRSQSVRTAAQTLVEVEDGPNGLQQITPVQRSAVPSADPVSQTTEWRLDLPPRDSAALVPGQQVKVRFAQTQSASVAKLVVPEAAVLRRGELTAVYIATATGFTLRAVRVGSKAGSDGYEVLAGLTSGEVVALDPIRAGFANAKPASSAK